MSKESEALEQFKKDFLPDSKTEKELKEYLDELGKDFKKTINKIINPRVKSQNTNKDE